MRNCMLPRSMHSRQQRRQAQEGQGPTMARLRFNARRKERKRQAGLQDIWRQQRTAQGKRQRQAQDWQGPTMARLRFNARREDRKKASRPSRTARAARKNDLS